MKTKNIIKTLFCMAILGGMTSCTSSECDKTDCPDAKGATEAVIQNIMTRVSVREFTDRKISKDTLESIVKAGMAAPSAVNKQPWAFVVITEKAVLDSLREVHPYSNLKTATAAIVVCGDLSRALEGAGQEYWVQDCSAATENILLAAHAYGIGAVWCGVYPNPERIPGVKKVLNLPENIMPLDIITMGYPAGDNQPKDKWDPAKVHYQTW